MGKFISLLIIFILSATLVSAESAVSGKVTIKIINRPPDISKIWITPDPAYPDSRIQCNTEASDELPDKVSYTYSWYRNDVLLPQKTPSIENMEADDEIRCEAVPLDIEGKAGEMKSASVKIQDMPLQVKLIKPALNTLGIKASTQDILKTASFSSITGNVVGAGSHGSSSILLMLIFIMVIVNINLIARIHAKNKPV